MKQLVFRYERLVKDINLKGYPNGIPDCFKSFKHIDGHNVFEDEESGLLTCYNFKDGCDYPDKYYVHSSWTEEVEDYE